jgi:hypothetical protein
LLKFAKSDIATELQCLKVVPNNAVIDNGNAAVVLHCRVMDYWTIRQYSGPEISQVLQSKKDGPSIVFPQVLLT